MSIFMARSEPRTDTNNVLTLRYSNLIGVPCDFNIPRVVDASPSEQSHATVYFLKIIEDAVENRAMSQLLRASRNDQTARSSNPIGISGKVTTPDTTCYGDASRRHANAFDPYYVTRIRVTLIRVITR